MGHLFYFFGLIILLLNIYTISKFKSIFDLKEWMVKFKEVTGRNPVSTDYRKPEDKPLLTSWSITIILTSLWVFFGLLSKSWYVYLFLLIFNALTNLIIKAIGEFNKFSFTLSFLKSVLILIVIGFLIINHFHIHLDIWKMIYSWLV